ALAARHGLLTEGAPIRRVVASGASQSAFRLVSYVNAFHRTHRVADGYMIDGRRYGSAPVAPGQRAHNMRLDGPAPAPLADDLDAPTIVVQSETDLLVLRSLAERSDDGPTTRLWEMAGAAHGDPTLGERLAVRTARDGLADAWQQLASTPSLPRNPFPNR